MILARLFNISCSDWEEALAAAFFLCGTDLPRHALSEGLRGPLGELDQTLRSLPFAWAQELAYEVLLLC